MEIIDYCVVRDDKLSRLCKEVLHLSSKGWIPQGGIAAEPLPHKDESFYCQAMIKPVSPKKEHHVTI